MIFKQPFFKHMVVLIRTSPSTSSLFFRRKTMARYMQNCGIPVTAKCEGYLLPKLKQASSTKYPLKNSDY